MCSERTTGLSVINNRGHPLQHSDHSHPGAQPLAPSPSPRWGPKESKSGSGGRRLSPGALTFSEQRSRSLCCFPCPSAPSWGCTSPQRVCHWPSLQLRPLQKMPRCEQRRRKRRRLRFRSWGSPGSPPIPFPRFKE